jgi:alpha-L-rhamnosidase
MRPEYLRTNYRTNPLGLDGERPEFSWRLPAAHPGLRQSAFLVQVAPTKTFDEVVWDSGQTASSDPFGVRYDGARLASMTRYHWRVRFWDGAGNASDWSEPAWFETGMLDSSQWWARWIGTSAPPSKRDESVLYLRGSLPLQLEVVWARAYVSALGWYRLFVNGEDLTGNTLVPRWTPYDKIVEYQVYDVTRHLRVGGNVVAMAIGNGRFRGRLGLSNRRMVYGDRLAGLVQLEVKLADGSRSRFCTDETWFAGSGRITRSDPMFGEHVDFRIDDHNWLRAPEPPARFAPARTVSFGSRELVAEEVERVCEIGRLRSSVWRSPKGKQIVDFGQNFAGVARVRLSGREGGRVRLTFSELLTADGELDTTYNRVGRRKVWYQRDEVILNGTDVWFQPWFTIHGFRYIEVDGLERELRPEDVEGIVLSSALDQAGSFHSSDSRLDRLHKNALWSLRSNFVDTPTDCPSRERSGWTGDIQVFAPTAMTMVDAQAYLRRYLRNVAIEQLPDGKVPPLVPSEASQSSGGMPIFERWSASSVGWGDVALMLPWALYRYYGDKAILEQQYQSMRKWVDHLARQARRRGRGRWFSRSLGDLEQYIVANGYHRGEWLRPGEGLIRDQLKSILIPSAVVATAYFANSSRILAKIAELLGRRDDALRYAGQADKVAAAWRAAFVRADGRIGEDKQDDYVRALALDLLLPQQERSALDRLVELVEEADHHLGTGFLSTPMLLPVLADNGLSDVAFRLLLQTTAPSWLYQVERGATTMWETWEGHDRKGNGRGSHNHYALGAVVGWCQEGLAGLSPAEPGYRRLRIAPVIGGGLTSVAASVETPFGTAASSWKLEGGYVSLTVTVPPGSIGEVHPGDGRVEEVRSGTHTFRWSANATATP